MDERHTGELHWGDGGGGVQHVTNVPHTKCSYHSPELTQTDFQRHPRPKTPFSHTKPNKDKWIYFIFQMRLLLGLLLYEPQKRIL